MRALVVCALALSLAGCGAMKEERELKAQESVQESRDAYETCMTIHSVDPDRCDSYKAQWQADFDVYQHLREADQADASPQQR